jgi:transposase InsO family protein
MVGDITCILTWDGWLYLATVTVCATRKVVGWAMDDNCKAPFITSAIKMAARTLICLLMPSSSQIGTYRFMDVAFKTQEVRGDGRKTG